MAKKASAVRFSTAAYQFAHGKAPRGTGLWAFRAPGSDRDLFFFNGSLSEAKKAAAQHFATVGVVVVEVCS